MGLFGKKKGQPGDQVSSEDAHKYIKQHGGQSDYLHYDSDGKVYSSDKKNTGTSNPGCFEPPKFPQE